MQCKSKSQTAACHLSATHNGGLPAVAGKRQSAGRWLISVEYTFYDASKNTKSLFKARSLI